MYVLLNGVVEHRRPRARSKFKWDIMANNYNQKCVYLCTEWVNLGKTHVLIFPNDHHDAGASQWPATAATVAESQCV